jgi:hypothetical protein
MLLNNPLRYSCPTCGCLVGERCVELETGDLMESFHRARQILAIPRGIDHVRKVVRSKPTVRELRERG